MSRTNFDQLLEAGCHFGHMKRKWNPAMAPYIFMERNGIHIIDLHKTVAKIDDAAEAVKQIAKSGKKILVVATQKQAKEVVAEINTELKAKGLKGEIKISETIGSFRGGFILEKGGVEINNTFESLVDSLKDQLEFEVAKVLFN